MDSGIIQSSTSYINSSFYAYKTSKVSSVEQDSTNLPKSKAEQDDDINDTVTISDKAMKLYAQDSTTKTSDGTSSDTSVGSDKKMSPAEKQEIQELKKRDTEVKSHEQAHLSAASGLSASAPSYTYQTGPDGKQYAIGGEVSITFVPSSDPDENIQKARSMKAAALAPSDPSSQDISVARQADEIIAKAEEQKKEKKSDNNNGSKVSTETNQNDSAEASGSLSENEIANTVSA